MVQLGDQDARDLKRLEDDLWRSEVRFSPDKMDALLADEFLEFGSSGRIYDKRQILDTPTQEIGARLPLADFSARVLAPSVVLVTYRSIQRHADGSEKQALRSSIWTRTEHGWKLVFHQGTPVLPAH